MIPTTLCGWGNFGHWLGNFVKWKISSTVKRKMLRSAKVHTVQIEINSPVTNMSCVYRYQMNYLTFTYLQISCYFKILVYNFDIFKNFMNFSYFKTLFKYFTKLLIFTVKWLSLLNAWLKYNRRYMVLFMHNNRYLRLTGLLTCVRYSPSLLKKSDIFGKIFQTKTFHEFFLQN